MTDATGDGSILRGLPKRPTAEETDARIKRRYRAENRFKAIGLAAVMIAFGLLGLLLFSIVSKGYTAFVQTYIQLDVTFAPSELGVAEDAGPAELRKASLTRPLVGALQKIFPGVEDRGEVRRLLNLLSAGARIDLGKQLVENPSWLGTTQTVSVLASDDIDQLVKGSIDRHVQESNRRVSDREIGWVDRLEEEGRIGTSFNTVLFTASDSREPERAGIWGAAVGSFYMMLVVFFLSVPLGVAAAVYLEEFAPKNNRWVDLIEVSINNLAAVPSIVFGLLGLAVFLNLMHLPRSAPLVGGLTLAIMTLPTIVVASRASLRGVPPSIREAALGVGASSIQVVGHHVLPLALPGILTGMIIGMARALGETAPLLMIGMVAFIASAPSGPLDPATALPVQIYIWADSPERAFTERTAAAIMILLGFLILMNALAVFFRKRFERKW
jgi:phosphate transport system permease protein